ncbi:J domain-containing protein DDB_G0295729 isoform X3 [Trichogramma pretiosum]|uniref:J domain-containing protein DDB_G0295729 isoform X3 n=1 Tax=Trichogramma pretiosum TaxID=7493 RepID=UPI000C7199C6|nr:J domain-containing protein DDB_G0295729 isoform X3 [Trichogramma pretiosum]
MKEHKESKSSEMHQQQQQQQQAGGDTSGGPVVLKSLLKKPGQSSRAKGAAKNRVVINEKMNEFFAADYIILIKEECCPDYEEECDCCCQEHEMIRLGNCKECRAELDLHFEDGSHGPDDECEDDEDDEDEDMEEDEVDDDGEDDNDIHHHRQQQQQQQQHHHHHQQQQQQQLQQQQQNAMNNKASSEQEQRGRINQARRQQQRETLSPPEGYKDLCIAAQARQEMEDAMEEEAAAAALAQQQQQQQQGGRPVCAECDYYQRQAATAEYVRRVLHERSLLSDYARSRGVPDVPSNANNAEDHHQQQHHQQQQPPSVPLRNNSINHDDATSSSHHQQQQQQQQQQMHDSWRTTSQDSTATEDSSSLQGPIDQNQQTTPDVQQRYLVETITMTTVTERRIVREISEEDSNRVGSLEDSTTASDGTSRQPSIESQKSMDDSKASNGGQSNGGDSSKSSDDSSSDKDKPSDLSLAVKIGSVNTLVSNSLKPNSAVRQLFPDPRFISPPPAPVKSLSADLEDAQLEDTVDGKFLVTAESLKLFDAVKRTKMGSSGRSESCDVGGDSQSSSTSIKRTIERNALRRSLNCKYDSLRRKNLRSKDLTLEERIRQLTCVDDNETDNGSATDTTSGGGGGNNLASLENNNTGRITHLNHNHQHHNHNHHVIMNGVGGMINNMMEGVDHLHLPMQLPTRTSPSGEERPNKGHVMMQQQHQQQQQQQQQPHHHHHHNHHGTSSSSAYRRITEMFGGQKKNSSSANNSDLNLPDISKQVASCNKQQQSNSNNKANKQFLASLAPLSCVSANSMDGREDYYQRLPVRMQQHQQHQHQHQHQQQQQPGDRNSISHNSDSSYSLEDIEDALNDGIPAPPDVTRGTPTSAGPSMEAFGGAGAGGNDASDELQAFVEQDKSRIERIKRRYESEDSRANSSSEQQHDNSKNKSSTTEDDDEDDELNDYGFNRRPSVRGIKAQFKTTNEIVHQLRTRSAAANSLPEACRLGFPGGNQQQQQQQDDAMSTSSAASDIYRVTYTNDVHADPSTITRINNMQKQINEIYQSIAESSISSVLLEQQKQMAGAGPIPYLDGTLPRTMSASTQAAIDHRNNVAAAAAAGGGGGGTMLNQARMLRIAGGGEVLPASSTPPGVYSTLPKAHRAHPGQIQTSYAAAGTYSCIVPQAQAAINNGQAGAQAAAAGSKCYRTMYVVPYNGNAPQDPTYQNLQRIGMTQQQQQQQQAIGYSEQQQQQLERYPYARNGRIEAPTSQQQQQLQQQQRYYVSNNRPATIPNTQTTSAALHLHLHQAEEFQVSSSAATGRPPSGALQISSAAAAASAAIGSQALPVVPPPPPPDESVYNVQTLSGVTYSICPPPPPSQTTATYTYQMQIQGK